MKRLSAALLWLLVAVSPALAQPFQQYAIPIGRGPGVTGFAALAPGAAGLPLVSAGAAANPIFGTASVAGGGTGLTSGTSGGIPYFSSSSTMASSGALTANRLVLGGGAGAAPTVLGAGTTATVLHGNASGAPTFGSVNLTGGADVTGVLPTTYGGTGVSVPSNHYMLIGSGSTALTQVAPGTSTYVWTSNGASSDPSWQASVPSAGSIDFAQLAGRVGQIPGTRNYFMGGAGNSSVSGTDNTGFGPTFAALTTGSENAVFGCQSSAAHAMSSGALISTSKNNTIMGCGAGVALTSQAAGALGFNAIFGYGAGMWLQSGGGTSSQENTFFGVNACNGVTTSVGNVCLGANAGQGYYLPAPSPGPLGSASTGNYNVFIGYNTASWFTASDASVIIGVNAGNSFTTGGANVVIGGSNLTGNYDPTSGPSGTAQTGSKITSLGYGITGVKTGSYDSLLGAEIVNCPSALTSATVIGARVDCSTVGNSEGHFADGAGNVRIKFDSAGTVYFPAYSARGIFYVGSSGLLQTAAGTSGGVVYFSAANVPASSGVLTANTLVLGGGAGAAPTSLAAGTTTTVLHGNASGAPTFGAVSLTTDVSGILPSTNGGTGANLSAGAAGGVPYFATTGVMAALGAGTSGQILTSGGAGAPTWSTVAGSTVATQSDMEAASSITAVVTPGRTHFHPGVPKAWAYVTESAGTYTLAANYNVSSVTKNSTGNLTINLGITMSSTSYGVLVGARVPSSVPFGVPASTSTVTVELRNFSNTNVEGGFTVAIMGDI